MQTGQPDIEARTYSCPKIKLKREIKQFTGKNTLRVLHMIISHRQIDRNA